MASVAPASLAIAASFDSVSLCSLVTSSRASLRLDLLPDLFAPSALVLRVLEPSVELGEVFLDQVGRGHSATGLEPQS